MLILRPSLVRFGSDTWTDVFRVAIESRSVELVEEWDDEGPYEVFVDSTKRKTLVRVIQDVGSDELSTPDPGSVGMFVVEMDRGNDADRRVVSMTAVVDSVSYTLSGTRSSREIRLVGVSSSGDQDPVSVTGGG
jgi:hypothetical protein